jgi:WD40 repeat protein
MTTGERIQLLQHDNRCRVLSATFSLDGAVVATACSDGSLRLWGAEEGTCLRDLRKGDISYTPKAAMSVAFCPAAERRKTSK